MSDDYKEPLRCWTMDTETVAYVLATMASGDSHMVVEDVFPIRGNRFMVLFRGSHPFLENEMKKEKPDIKRDTEMWPMSQHGGDE